MKEPSEEITYIFTSEVKTEEILKWALDFRRRHTIRKDPYPTLRLIRIDKDGRRVEWWLEPDKDSLIPVLRRG